MLVSCIMVTFCVAPEMMAGIFTKDGPTIEIVVDCLKILSLYLFFDAIHGVQSGNVRALGLQKMASITTLVCYYGIGLPLGLYLGFKKNLGVKGFWLGYLAALIMLDLIVGFFVIFADWSPKITEKPQRT